MERRTTRSKSRDESSGYGSRRVRVFEEPPGSPSATQSEVVDPRRAATTDDLEAADSQPRTALAEPARAEYSATGGSPVRPAHAETEGRTVPSADIMSDSHIERFGFAGTAETSRTADHAPIGHPVHTEHRVLHEHPVHSAHRVPFGRSAAATAPSIGPASVNSASSLHTRIHRAEYEAEKRLFEIRKMELQMEAELIKKKLRVDISQIEEEEGVVGENQPGKQENIRGEINPPITATPVRPRGEPADLIERVDDWLQRSATSRREEGGRLQTEDPHGAATIEGHRKHDNAEKASFPTATRQRSPGRGIDRLADALERMVRDRPPPRQAMELPIFTGASIEWLPFKAAVTETTKLYRISAAENLARLRNCLRGEAKEAVAALLYTATDPDVIMKTLEQCFGRPEIIIDKITNDIKCLVRPGPSASDLNSFAIKVQNNVCILKSIDERGYIHNPLLVREIVEKLSAHHKSRWSDFAYANGSMEEPELITLSRFLMREADLAMRYVRAPATQVNAPPGRKTTNRREASYPIEEERPKVQCTYCGMQNHVVTACRKFSAANAEEKWKWAKTNRVCFQCLVRKHRRDTCRAKLCGVNECTRRHHALLHSEIPQTPSTSSKTEAVMSIMSDENQKVYLKVCPVVISGPKGEAKTYALFDEGSTISLIKEDLADEIGAKGGPRDLTLKGINGTRKEKSSSVKFEIKGESEREPFTMSARTIKDLRLHEQSIPRKFTNFEHLKGLSRACYDQEIRPQILIGTDNWDLIVSRKLRTGKAGEPIASKTRLGWVIHGTAPRTTISVDEESTLHIVAAQDMTKDVDLENLVRRHYEADSIGITSAVKYHPDVQRAIDVFERTVKRHGEGFEVGLPWKTDAPQLPANFHDAFKRLKSIERKMDKDAQFQLEYTREIENLIAKGYAEKCREEETRSDIRWFLPHFAVKNPNKPEKIRLVFDAAAKSNGVSLNDRILEGPDLLKSLMGILFRFRENRIAVTADIQEMFLRIKIRREDQSAQLFLWRGRNRTGAPQTYKMTSMIFGASSSPFLAHSVRNKNATDHATEHPDAAYAICHNHYMDDYLDSFKSEEEAARTVRDVIKIHKAANFHIRGWNSNHEEALKDIPDQMKSQSVVALGTGPSTCEKTLGLLWDAGQDRLGFNTAIRRLPTAVRTEQRYPTKREILSAVMSLYDPLGLLSPFTITVKILLQEIWREKLGWDEPVSKEHAQQFAKWTCALEKVTDLRIPRKYVERTEIKSRELHTFCDASEQAYTAAVYWRVLHEDGEVEVALAAAKSRVAPLKPLSVPRLELQAALIGTRLAEEIIKEHRWEPQKTFYWTDSKTVLQWIRTDARRYTPYVAHRLGEISEKTSISDWKWVPTGENVADDATRAAHGYHPTERDRWFRGPEFLYKENQHWPTETNGETEPAETALIVTEMEEPTPHPSLPEITRISSYTKLIRSTAYVLLFLEKCRKRANGLEVRHLNHAQRLWETQSQKESFREEIATLTNGQHIKKTSRLYKLDPCLDEDLLKLRGRIDAAGITAEQKRPILLDGRHRYTELLIAHEHEKAGHANNERVVNNLRQRAWILRLRPTVRAMARRCQHCRVNKATPEVPAPGNLPVARLGEHHRPFSDCGIDYFGPITVTIGRRHEKRWVALFTCLATRAVHLEIVDTLSTDSAIMALRRMAARRGWPKTMHSDNGTNFRGADVELRRAYETWAPHLKEEGLRHRMGWYFIPPAAPHMGGAWERLVRSVKTALATTLKEKSPREELLRTLLAEAEYSVNSRPLTHVSVDPNDPEALTPNHFLLGSSAGLPSTGPCSDTDRATWKRTQALADTFWQRWVKEYLPTLNPRGKSESAARPLQPGDLVVVVDSTLPRNTWPRGVVEATHRGSDGKVRVADVRTKGGVFKRPVTKLAVLPV